MVRRALKNVGYNINATIAFTIFCAAAENIPILQEGPAGAGKTEMALALSRASGMKLIRLQCYEGITEGQAIGEFNKSLQDLYVLLARDSGRGWSDDLAEEIKDRKFFVPGPLLQAIESEERVILLIDEIDKIPMAFEAMLLQLLSAWEVSTATLGTITAKTIPFTILTSNAMRELSYALRRRVAYLELVAPTPEEQAEIVSRKSPNLRLQSIFFIACFGEAIRSYRIEKPPAISEMNHLALIMDRMGWKDITVEQGELIFPILIKVPKDLRWIRTQDQFAAILNSTHVLMEKKMALYGIIGWNEEGCGILASDSTVDSFSEKALEASIAS
jgi:MoxR-like ATPase